MVHTPDDFAKGAQAQKLQYFISVCKVVAFDYKVAHLILTFTTLYALSQALVWEVENRVEVTQVIEFARVQEVRELGKQQLGGLGQHREGGRGLV